MGRYMVNHGKEISKGNLSKIIMLYGKGREIDNTTVEIKARDKCILVSEYRAVIFDKPDCKTLCHTEGVYILKTGKSHILYNIQTGKEIYSDGLIEELNGLDSYIKIEFSKNKVELIDAELNIVDSRTYCGKYKFMYLSKVSHYLNNIDMHIKLDDGNYYIVHIDIENKKLR